MLYILTTSSPAEIFCFKISMVREKQCTTNLRHFDSNGEVLFVRWNAEEIWW